MRFFKRQTIHERKVGDRSIILTADGDVEINPAGGDVRLDGNLTVTGNVTGPKTADILYVSQDGNDNNDGRSAGPNGAKRTIKNAVASATPGTTILVGPGDFYEDNPIVLPDRVTISGTGELRNTQVWPKNNTQTIFYVGNGCYLYQLTFRGLRSPGWCVEIRPGTLCTQSPYVQNCSNINGPWLNDGTEFIPFETVQLEGIEPSARPLLVEDYPELPFEKQINDYGGGGGMYVDGDQYDPASLVFSMVADAFTQIAQGGIGFWIDNFGYTQIVSCFTVFCSTGFKTTRGGYLSISNSVSDFGIEGVVADGFYPIAYTNAKPQQNYFSTVASVTIQNPGIGYTNAPQVVIEAPDDPGGTTAIATADVDPTTGQLSGVTIIDSGSGYTQVPQITFVGGGATIQAQGVVNLQTNSVVRVNSLRDKPGTGSIIKFDGDPTYYYIVGTDIIRAPFVYDEEICRRDTRLIIEAVTGDIVLGTTYQSQQAATSYLRSTANKVIRDQLEPTVYALESARDLMKAEITNQAMKDEIDQRFNIITSTLNKGDSSVIPEAGSDLVFNDLAGIDQGIINAKNNILDNRDFIIAEITAFINDQFTELSYNQPQYVEDMKDLIYGVAMDVALGSNLHVVRLGQEINIRPRFKEAFIDSFQFIKSTVENLTAVQTDSTSLSRVTEAFNTFINITDDGDSSAIVIDIPDHAGASGTSNPKDAKDQLVANKDFLVAEFVEFIKQDNPLFTFDEQQFEIDFARFVDALTFDILYGGDSATVQETKYYYNNFNLAGLLDTQRQTIVDAFARMRFVISRVVRGLFVAKTPSNPLSQDFSSNNATQSEADALDALLFNTEDVIANLTLTRLPVEKTYPQYETEPVGQRNAANTIIGQATTIINAAQTNINNNYPTLTYNVEKCKRDVGYIVDAVYIDAQLGTNHNSITAGLAYSRANTAYFNLEQRPATIIALREAKRLSVAAASRNIDFQNEVDKLWTDVLNIIEYEQLPSEGTEYDDPGPASNELIATRDQLIANREFLIQETTAFINNSYFIYDQAKCERDTGLIIDAAYYDSALGTNYNQVTAGLAYQRANSGYVQSDQQTETVGAINFAKGLSTTATSSNVTAQTRVSAAFDEVVDIIVNGTTSTDDAADPLVFPTTNANATAAQIEAAAQLQNNRNFLAAEAVAFINNNYVNFTYNQAKCERDIGLMLDAIALDVALGTNYNSVTAGLAYQRASSSVVQNQQQLQTIEAIRYLRERTVLLGFTANAEARVVAGFDEILDILENGVVSTDTAADPLVFPSPVGVDVDRISAKDQLIANKEFIKDEIIAWIADNFPTLTYDAVKCERDVGYIVDALCHDILYGGNFATRTVANSYFVDGVSQLGSPAEEAATADAYARLRNIVSDIVIEATVVKTTGNSLNQDTSGTPASSTQADEVAGLVAVIEQVIRDGNLSSLPAEQLPSVLWTNVEYQQAYNVIKGNKILLQTETTAFISDTFQNFTFNSDKCNRDTKYIVDALTYDILYGGNSASVEAARSYFVGTTSQVAGQQQQTANALTHVSNLLNDVLLDVVVTVTEQVDQIQDTTAGAASVTEVAKAISLLQTFQDVIINGIDNLPTKTLPDLTNVDAGVKSAIDNLDAQKTSIIADTIDFIATTYNGFSYDEAKCQRDTGFLIDAVVHDALYTGNYATLIATNAYFLGTAQYIPANQKAQTVAAFTHLKQVAGECIKGIAVTPTPGNTETQQLLGNYGTTVEEAIADSKFDLVINAIDTGGTVGPQYVQQLPDFTWLSESTKSVAADLLAEKVSIQNSVIDYITENLIGFEYNIAKCERDTGYIIDSALYDMMYGGNKQTKRAALAYYNGAILGAATVGNTDQVAVTAYSYYHLANVLQKVANNEPIVPSFNNPLTQDLSIPDGNTLGGDTLKLLVDRIGLAVFEGSTTGWQEINHDYTLGSSVYLSDRETILAAEDEIVDAAIADLNLTYGGIADIQVFPGIISVTTDKQAALYNVSTISTSGHAFEYVGAGITYNALPFFGGTAVPALEIQEFNQGKVFAGGTVDQIGNFRVGNFFSVSALDGSITLNANQLDLSGLTSIGPLIRDGIPVGIELKEISNNPALLASTGIQDPNTAPTQQAVALYVENRYLNKLTGGTISGNLVLNGDFDVNGDVISTNETGPFSLLNTSATTINAFGAATEINIGAADGLVTINPDLLVEGNITVNGDIVFNGDVSLNIPDESLQAYSITTEGSLDYISINTRTDEEKITFGDRPLIEIQNTTNSVSIATGALVVDGGVGIAKNLNVGGNLDANLSVTLGSDRAIHTVDINAVTDIDVPDNRSEVFLIHENITDYFIVNTIDGAENITIGQTPNLIVLNQDDATDATTGALQVAGGMSAQFDIHAGVDITAGRDLIALRNIEVNGTEIITDETGTFNVFNSNATTINAFGDATAINIGATTGLITFANEQVIFDSVKTIQIPVGTTADRPTPATGQIRFNSDTVVFEGYDGIAWGSLGGVKDVDQDTFIRPESSPNADNDELEFFVAGTRRLLLDATQFYLEATNDVTILNDTQSIDYQTGAVKISGGVGIAKNLHVNGFISGKNNGVLQLTDLATDKILIKAETIESPEQLRIITGADDSSGDEIIYPITLVNRSDGGSVVAGAGTGIKFEIETQNDNFEVSGIIDVVAQDITGNQEDFDMVFRTMNSGATASEKLRLSETVSTFAGDLVIQGNDLTTTQTTFNLLNTTPTTINAFGTATAINIGATGGLTTLDQNLTVNEDVTIEGTLILTNNDLEVQYGGTGVSTFTENGILYGDTANPVKVTDAAGTSDTSTSFQILTVTSDVDATPVWTDTIDGGSF